MRPIIQSEKHYVQFSPTSIALGAIATKFMVDSVAVDAKNDVDEVVEGSIVKAVFLELWIVGDDTPISSFKMSIEKLSGDMSIISVGEMAALGDYVNKKNVLYMSQGLTPGNTNYPQVVFKAWIKIPKGKQRFGLADKLALNITADLDGLLFCGFCTYKSYT